MLLGGMVEGETRLNAIHSQTRRVTISGYLEDRIASPYQSPGTGSTYLTQVNNYNPAVPDNLFLVVGDEQLETQASRVANATRPGPQRRGELFLWGCRLD
jgi:hypothetical protein